MAQREKELRKKERGEKYICAACGDVSSKWFGKCPSCGKWNTLEEVRIRSEHSESHNQYRTLDLPTIQKAEHPRIKTGFSELDRALGGGIVRGSVVLMGGEPGIGKSTLMLQVAGSLAQAMHKVLYVSGEESLEQLRLRAERCNVINDKVLVSNGATLEYIVSAIDKHQPEIVICDSIQVLTCQESGGIAGSVSQIREVSARLIELAKHRQFALILIGHITKEGQIAGPKLLEHAVDTVMYFEHTGSDQVRILRTHKNRFGPTFEIGIFEMQGSGLKEVEDASSLFMHQYEGPRIGSVFYPSLQGTRPIILEVQALTSPCQFGAPRRQGMGLDNSRVALLAAILEKNLKLRFSTQDIFVNIVGGVVDRDPAMDLAISLCLISSIKQKPVPKNILVCGECGLSGEVRRVSQLGRRLKEAASLKLSPWVLPDVQRAEVGKVSQELSVQYIKHVTGLVQFIQ